MSPQNNNILLPVVFKIKPGQDFKGQGHYRRTMVKSGLHHDDAHLHPLSLPSIRILPLIVSECAFWEYIKSWLTYLL